jgi:PAS domain S-box-containing protein
MGKDDRILLITRTDQDPPLDLQLRRADGTAIVPEVAGPASWISTLRDREFDLVLSPSELLHEHAFERGQREVLELIAAGAPLGKQLEQIVLLIEAQAPGMLCSILLLDEQSRLRTGAAPSLPEAFVNAINGAEIGPCEGSCGAAAYRGEVVIVEDIASHEYWKNYKQFALPHGLRACWSTPILSAAGKVLGTFAMYFNETRSPGPRERHWVNRATHIAAVALQRGLNETQLRLQAYVHNAVTDVIFYLAVEPSERYRFLSINPAFGVATGLSDEKVVGHLVSDVIPEPSLGKVLQHYRQAIEERRTVRWLEITPYPTGTKYGQVSIAPVFSSDGTCTNLIGTVHDITEQHLAQEQVFRAQRLESLGTFVGGIAHDFNNILMAISWNAAQALAQRDVSSSVEALSQIEQASARGSGLVKQLLTFGRRQEPQRSIMNLPQVVTEALSLLRASLAKSIELETSFAEDVPSIFADATQIHQVVINLATNAAHAMAENGGVLSVRADRSILDREAASKVGLSPGIYARLVVSDAGTGMTEATLQRIFDPFFTTKDPDKGTGLGLSVVHGIVRAHEGAVVVQSTLGRGSAFEVYFPA